MGEHFPKAVAGAAVANGHQVLLGGGRRPYAIDLVATDEVHQTGLLTPVQMDQCLFFTDHASQAGIYLQRGLSQEQAAQVPRVVMALCRGAADAIFHEEVIAGPFHEVAHHR